MWDGIDRRKFPRADYPCQIKVKRKNSPEAFSTHTENIGVGGICVPLKKDIGRFSEVAIELDILDDRPAIVCDGTIVWIVKSSDGFDTGIEFKNLKEQDKERINTVIDKILKRGS